MHVGSPAEPTADAATHPLTASVLTSEALAFLGELHALFGDRRRDLLDARTTRQQCIDRGLRPEFRADTAHIRSGGWTVASAPADLTNRRTEITGPVTREFMTAALESGADVFMADFEDATAPTWDNIVTGQHNVAAAYRGEITPPPYTTTLMVRTRAWHLDEKHITVDGEPMAAALVDFGLCVFHNAKVAVGRGTAPYFYLPKVEGQDDARLWNDVFDHAESRLELGPGTIRATVLVETILAAFEMEEILYELRDHITGLHTGNWDYLFSVAKTFRADPSFVLPDRDRISVTTPFMRAFTELLVATCHRRGAHAIGGMSGVNPEGEDEERIASALRKVSVDKRREAGDGFDGTRIAHPGLVPVARAEFDKVLGSSPNQIARQRDDVFVMADDLLTLPGSIGAVTISGVRTNIAIVIRYLGEWLSGNAAVVIDDHLEDTAMAEVCRAQLWSWRHHAVEVSDGQILDDELLDQLIDEEFASLRAALAPAQWANGRFDEARTLLRDLVTTDDYPDFLTIPAYELL
ncbi:MAG: malate synthase [Acidimicrobiales bacterium]|nr:MAG: malate synthase [Acidimicrobiales bacterium]